MRHQNQALGRYHSNKKTALLTKAAYIRKNGDPYGIRTRVAAVKGQCPRPLDEGVSLEARVN